MPNSLDLTLCIQYKVLSAGLSEILSKLPFNVFILLLALIIAIINISINPHYVLFFKYSISFEKFLASVFSKLKFP